MTEYNGMGGWFLVEGEVDQATECDLFHLIFNTKEGNIEFVGLMKKVGMVVGVVAAA